MRHPGGWCFAEQRALLLLSRNMQLVRTLRVGAILFDGGPVPRPKFRTNALRQLSENTPMIAASRFANIQQLNQVNWIIYARLLNSEMPNTEQRYAHFETSSFCLISMTPIYIGSREKTEPIILCRSAVNTSWRLLPNSQRLLRTRNGIMCTGRCQDPRACFFDLDTFHSAQLTTRWCVANRHHPSWKRDSFV